MKFESHRILFDSGLSPIKRFLLKHQEFFPFYACTSLFIGGTMLCYSSKFVQRPCLRGLTKKKQDWICHTVDPMLIGKPLVQHARQPFSSIVLQYF